MAAPPVIVKLVEHFARNADVYRTNLNETEVRVQFIDPFFEALGWDIHNKQHYAETYKDVIHEYSLRTAAHTEAPDYCFQVGGTRKFYVEAKRPAIHVSADPAPAYQLRSYAWTSKLPLSLLTNFGEFAVYDCRVLPRPSDKSSVARIDLITFDQYPDKWDEIVSRFSREAVYQGSFDRYTESSKLKKGTAEVDDAFLAEIESWRKELASNLALRNSSLSQREVNFAVQRTIDRIIFLRICEDRGIEKYGQLQELQQGEHIYRRLCTIYERADEKYNSGLFHFTDEKDRAEAPDKLTPSLKIDDIRLKPILRRLYYPESPYQFSHFPADILGQVYEQFLGQVIRLTSGHQAKVEPKPEVKKAGGVYYTPTYIVDYIIRSTVAKLLEGKSVNQASKLRILDPACGSGSFLLGAYKFLMDWHRDEYLKEGAGKHRKELYQTQGGDWHLTTTQKKRILLNNIYGVDIDSQAVEVTKLSLLLKVLEGESEQTIGTNLRLFHERALPDLADNIKCGNSIIGRDFYENEQMSLLDDDERYRVNVFDWDGSDGFAEIMKGGGFDAVIGNPPYVNAWELYNLMPYVREFIKARSSFSTAERHWDLYVLFLERSLKLARQNGLVSFIIPYSYAIQKYAMASRSLILKQYKVESVADLRAVRVFGKIPVITIIPVISKALPDSQHEVQIFGPGPTATKFHPGVIRSLHTIAQKRLYAQQEHMLRIDLTQDAQTICDKLESASFTVGDLCLVNYGAQMSSREKGGFGKGHVLRSGKVSKTCKKTVSGRNLYRYAVSWDGKWVEWSLAPQMYGPREPEFFETPKLMIRDITGTHRLELTLDESGLYCDHTILCALRAADVARWKEISEESVELSQHFSLQLLLGLLASRLVSVYYYWKLTGEGVRIGGGFHTYPKTIRQLPVFDIRRASTDQKELLLRIEKRAYSLLAIHNEAAAARTTQERVIVQRQMAADDRQIDQLVYQLYGLTEREIALVEAD